MALKRDKGPSLNARYRYDKWTMRVNSFVNLMRQTWKEIPEDATGDDRNFYRAYNTALIDLMAKVDDYVYQKRCEEGRGEYVEKDKNVTVRKRRVMNRQHFVANYYWKKEN